MTQVHGTSWPGDMPAAPNGDEQPDLSMFWMTAAVLAMLACVPVLLVSSSQAVFKLGGVVVFAGLAMRQAYLPVHRFVAPRLVNSTVGQAAVLNVAPKPTQAGTRRAVVHFVDPTGVEQRRTMWTSQRITVGQHVTVRLSPADPSWAMLNGADVYTERLFTFGWVGFTACGTLLLAIGGLLVVL